MSVSTTPIPRTDSTASKLRRDILSGLQAPGTLLAETSVAEKLGVSRVPVREALIRLEREGLVEFSATGRAFVKDLSPQDFEELYVMRCALEPLAAKLAFGQLHLDAGCLEANLKQTRAAKSIADVTRLDLDFHELILTATGNSRLLKVWNSLRGELDLWLGRLHRMHQSSTKDTLRDTLTSHQRLINAFQKGSAAVCEREMRSHIVGWKEWLPVMPLANEEQQ
jgi:DNA-binding GntR family transcriptional regulator